MPLPNQQLADPQTVYRHLERVRAEHGYVPTSMLDYWADLAGKSSRTLQHWLTTGSAPTYQRPRYSLDERLRQLYFDCRGNVSLVHRKAREENLDPPSRETLSRRFRDEMTPFERAFASSGDGGARRHTIKLHADDPPHRWYCQQADHFRLDTLIVSEARDEANLYLADGRHRHQHPLGYGGPIAAPRPEHGACVHAEGRAT